MDYETKLYMEYQNGNLTKEECWKLYYEYLDAYGNWYCSLEEDPYAEW